MKLAEPPSATSEEMTRGKVEAVGPTGQVGRPGRSVGLLMAPTAPIFVQQAVLGLLFWSTLVLACLGLSKLGSCTTFSPSEPESVLR